MIRTRQREAIVTVLRETGRPLTREEILEFGRRKVERLGPATVDRTIRELVRQFEIVGVHFPGQPRRYELPAEQEHPHFVCRSCDRVFDLPVKMELPRVPMPKGFKATGGEVIYTGTCPDCTSDKA